MTTFLPLILLAIVVVPQFLPIHPALAITLSTMVVVALAIALQAPMSQYGTETLMTQWPRYVVDSLSTILYAAILALVLKRCWTTAPTGALTVLYGMIATVASPTAYGIGRTLWPAITQGQSAKFDHFVAGFALFSLGWSIGAAFIMQGLRTDPAAIETLMLLATLTPLVVAPMALAISEWRSYTKRPQLQLAPYLWLLVPLWLHIATEFCYFRGYMAPEQAIYIYLILAVLIVGILTRTDGFKPNWPILREGLLSVAIFLSTIIIPAVLLSSVTLNISVEAVAYAQTNPWAMKFILVGMLGIIIVFGFIVEAFVLNMLFGYLLWLSFDTISLNGHLLSVGVMCAALIGFIMPRVGLLDRRRQASTDEQPTMLRWGLVGGLTISMLLLVLLPDMPSLLVDDSATPYSPPAPFEPAQPFTTNL